MSFNLEPDKSETKQNDDAFEQASPSDANPATAVEEPDESGHYDPVPGASILHQLTQMGTMMGTPDYIAPEQAQDAHTADIRADIYSLGCTFYTLLTGKPPFGEGSVLDKIKAHTQKDAPPISNFRDDVPAEVEGVLRKMMAKDPNERFQTPVDVAKALAQCSPDAPRPDMRVSESPAYKKRRTLILTAVATLFPALIAAAVFYIQTDNGVVRVEVTDPSLAVTISGRTITMDDGEKPLTIRAGEQKLIVRQNDSDFELVTDSFQLRCGDEIALKVELLPGEVVVSKVGERFGAKPLPGEQLIVFAKRLQSANFHRLALSPDGRTLLTTGSDPLIHVWQLPESVWPEPVVPAIEEISLIDRFRGRRERVRDVRFFPMESRRRRSVRMGGRVVGRRNGNHHPDGRDDRLR